MPEITETTPKTSITIATKQFNVAQPYAAGHVLNSGEASALNQTYAENVRNNRASSVKEAIEKGTFDQDVLQGAIDDYCAGYEFGVRTGGGRTTDPVQAEAMNIARDLVRKALAKQVAAGTLKDAEGTLLKLSDVPASKISALAKGVLERNDEKAAKILATARQRVEDANEIEDVEVDVSAEASADGDEAEAA